jgi:hypothetical protein
MTDPTEATESTESQSPNTVRIGSAEREAAITSLGGHMAAGRLEPDEYGDRVAKASVARYTSDLAPLFDDLPKAADPIAVTRPSAQTSPAKTDDEGRSPLFGRAGTTIVALSPFIALALFFGLNALDVGAAWLAFLLIPAAGALIYGGGHPKDPKRSNR